MHNPDSLLLIDVTIVIGVIWARVKNYGAKVVGFNDPRRTWFIIHKKMACLECLPISNCQELHHITGGVPYRYVVGSATCIGACRVTST